MSLEGVGRGRHLAVAGTFLLFSQPLPRGVGTLRSLDPLGSPGWAAAKDRRELSEDA